MKNLKLSNQWTAFAVFVLFLLSSLAPLNAASAGSALNFDGTNGYVQIGASAIPIPWTATFWVNRQDSPDVSAQLLNDAANALKLEQYATPRKVGFTIFGVDDYSFDYTAPAGVWTHLAFVGTASGITLYANGRAVGTNAATMSLPLARLGNTGDRLKGVLDEVTIWSRALSALEVQTNMDRLLPGPLPDLAAYWRFNEGSGTNVNDTSGQGHGGILINGVSWVPSRAPDWPVISANVVGYANRTLPDSQTSLIANPFNNGDNSLDAVFPLPLAAFGSTIFKFLVNSPLPYIFGFMNPWDIPPGLPPRIPPGDSFLLESFLLEPLNSLNVTLVGEVPEGHFVQSLPEAGKSIYLASIVPQARRIGALGGAGTMQLPVQPGDFVRILSAQQVYVDYNYDGFSWTPGDPNGPLIEVGGGFILTRGQGPALSWNRDFTVSSVTGPTLQIALTDRSDGPVRITWTEPGWMLQQADDPEGPWTVVAGKPTSPYQFQPPVGTKKFYRLTLAPHICVVNGRGFEPSNPLYESMLISWPDPGFKLQATGKLAADPVETIWSDVSSNLYINYSPTNLGPDACGHPNGGFVAIDMRNRGISNSPAGSADFSATLGAAQAGVANSIGHGAGTISLTTTNGTNYAVSLNIGFNDLSTNWVNARIHGPPRLGGGTNLYFLPISGSQGTNGAVVATRILVDNAGGLGFTVAQQLEQLRSGQWSISIVSRSHLNGEIRGPIYLERQFFRLMSR